MTAPIYREGDEVEIVRRGVIVATDPRDPHRYGIGRPDRYGVDAYFRTDDDEVTHRLASSAEPVAATTEKTIADELRKAAAILRETAIAAIAGPWASLDGGDRLVAWRTGDDFEYVVDEPIDGASAEWMALVNPLLAEPLSRWLEDTATVVTSFKVPTHPLHEPCDDPVCYTAHSALAVARVVNGAAS